MGQLIEWLFERVFHVQELDPDDPEVAFRIACQTYKGSPLELSDGTLVSKGDRVVELHMKNDRLANLHREHDDPSRVGLGFARLMQVSLIALAEAWESDPRFTDVVAAFGVNLFPEVCARGGFERRQLLPAWRRRFLSWHIRRIIASAHPQGKERVMKDGQPRQVEEVWISRDQCLDRHGGRDRGSDALDYFRKRGRPEA